MFRFKRLKNFFWNGNFLAVRGEFLTSFKIYVHILNTSSFFTDTLPKIRRRHIAERWIHIAHLSSRIRRSILCSRLFNSGSFISMDTSHTFIDRTSQIFNQAGLFDRCISDTLFVFFLCAINSPIHFVFVLFIYIYLSPSFYCFH